MQKTIRVVVTPVTTQPQAINVQVRKVETRRVVAAVRYPNRRRK